MRYFLVDLKNLDPQKGSQEDHNVILAIEPYVCPGRGPTSRNFGGNSGEDPPFVKLTSPPFGFPGQATGARPTGILGLCRFPCRSPMLAPRLNRRQKSLLRKPSSPKTMGHCTVK